MRRSELVTVPSFALLLFVATRLFAGLDRDFRILTRFAGDVEAGELVARAVAQRGGAVVVAVEREDEALGRREEVAGMNWSELDRTLAVWTIPASRAKNNKTHIVPLSSAVIAELDCVADVSGEKIPWPAFGPVLTSGGRVSIKSYSKGKVALDKAVALLRGQSAPIDHWRVHDLRRTLATGLQKLGVRFEVTEAVLNHTSGSKGGVAGVYQRHDWADEKRAALEAWAAYVGRLVTGADTSNVIALGARA